MANSASPGRDQACGVAAQVFRLSFGPKSFVVVSDAEVARHMLLTNATNYSKGLLSEILDFVMGTGGPVVGPMGKHAGQPIMTSNATSSDIMQVCHVTKQSRAASEGMRTGHGHHLLFDCWTACCTCARQVFLRAEQLIVCSRAGLIPADGEVWKVRRRAIVPSLHRKYIENMIHMFGNSALHGVATLNAAQQVRSRSLPLNGLPVLPSSRC